MSTPLTINSSPCRSMSFACASTSRLVLLSHTLSSSSTLIPVRSPLETKISNYNYGKAIIESHSNDVTGGL